EPFRRSAHRLAAAVGKRRQSMTKKLTSGVTNHGWIGCTHSANIVFKAPALLIALSKPMPSELSSLVERQHLIHAEPRLARGIAGSRIAKGDEHHRHVPVGNAEGLLHLLGIKSDHRTSDISPCLGRNHEGHAGQGSRSNRLIPLKLWTVFV